MRRALAHAALLLAATLAVSCAGLTQIMIVVDTDLDVPNELDAIRVQVVGPSGEVRQSTADLTGSEAHPLPRTLALVHDGGALGPVLITVSGLRGGPEGGQEIVQRRARLWFVPGEVRMVRLDLFRACVGVSCGPEQTCGVDGCRSRDLSADELEPWTGEPSRLDGAAAMDAGVAEGGLDACVPRAEECNGRDDDCDGRVDEDFDLETDPEHCGACDNACPTAPANASSRCEAAECVLDCYPGWADCDDSLETGCEALLSAPSTCGGCDVACADPEPLCARPREGPSQCVASCEPLELSGCGGSCVDLDVDAQHCGGCDLACASRPNAHPLCTDGECAYACLEGWHDCNERASDGCETRLRDLANCGGCGVSCALPNATATCADGTCRVAVCDPGFADCDTTARGCEASIRTDPRHCGGCGLTCPIAGPNAVAACDEGRCGLRCEGGFANCDGDPDTGCEADLGSAEACGGCGLSCEDPSPLCASDPEGARCVDECAEGRELCGTSCVDLERDPKHCGACGAGCVERPNASAECHDRECRMVCDEGFADCNGDVTDGCESDLRSSTSCGGCGNVCAPPNARGSCESGACVILECDPGFGDCNGDVADGCETPLGTTDSCSGCGDRCPESAPNAAAGSMCDGSCVLVCDPGFEDCNAQLADGCETSLSSVDDCGACGAFCARANAFAICETGTCRIESCHTGYSDCDLVDANGCETSIRSLENCGACGEVCALDRASESCVTGACRIESCHDGYESCDGSHETGCEASLKSLSHCGACDVVCSLANANPTCASFSCAIASCHEGFGDCDGLTSNGCETDLTGSDAHCGGCGMPCMASDSCCNGACCDGTCCDGTCCPLGRTCCGGTCCAVGELCMAGECRRP